MASRLAIDSSSGQLAEICTPAHIHPARHTCMPRCPSIELVLDSGHIQHHGVPIHDTKLCFTGCAILSFSAALSLYTQRRYPTLRRHIRPHMPGCSRSQVRERVCVWAPQRASLVRSQAGRGGMRICRRPPHPTRATHGAHDAHARLTPLLAPTTAGTALVGPPPPTIQPCRAPGVWHRWGAVARCGT